MFGIPFVRTQSRILNARMKYLEDQKQVANISFYTIFGTTLKLFTSSIWPRFENSISWRSMLCVMPPNASVDAFEVLIRFYLRCLNNVR